MEFEQQGVVLINLDQFWPVQHPIEPPEEDQPVKYPIPESSQTKDNEANEEKVFYGETLRRKAKLLEVIDRKEMMEGTERRRRAVRRRHRVINQLENRAATPLSPVSPCPPFHQSNSVAIFQK